MTVEKTIDAAYETLRAQLVELRAKFQQEAKDTPEDWEGVSEHDVIIFFLEGF